MSKRHKKVHVLKTWPPVYQSTRAGLKTFEMRKNDRDFRVNDILVLQEYDPIIKEYTGEMSSFVVTYMLQGDFGLPPETCIMSIVPMEEDRNGKET